MDVKVTKPDNMGIKEYVRNIMAWGGTEADEDELKAKYEARIRAKLKAGKRLSAEEKRYLKKYNHTLYVHVIRIEHKIEKVENSLKHAKSKKEVQEICFFELSTIGKSDPVKEYMIAAVKETVKEFKETSAYKRLPKENPEEKKSAAEEIIPIVAGKKSDRENDMELVYEGGIDSYQMIYLVD